MEQQKTGKFIAEMRKEQGLTQRELAEKLMISDKTVSKWECGNGLPEISLMLPLCEILKISVNELLTGKRLQSSEYKKNAEDNLMKLINEKEHAKRSLWLGIIAFIPAFLAGITLIMIAGYFDLEVWQRIVLIVIAVLTIAAGLTVAVVLEVHSGAFECANCGKRFMPKMGAYLAGLHTATRRYLKCPYCGQSSMCIRRFSLHEETEEEK
ncbi:MAG: helix-turn-helix domain-containing protein [Clostridia bacterium]|nr:helix-turn-helix domain-containing protein [Clostridia bacterium]